MPPLLERCASSPYQSGLAHGRAFPDLIRANIDVTLKRLERLGMTGAEACREAREWTRICEGADSDYVVEMQGIADAAGVSFDHICVQNFRFELALPLTARKFAVQHSLAPEDLATFGCTSFFAQGSPPEHSSAWTGQTLDGLEEMQDNLVVIQSRMNERKTIALHEAGAVGPSIGLSSSGFGLTYNGMITLGSANPEKVPPVRQRLAECLRAPSAEAAAEALLRAPIPCAMAVMLATTHMGATLVEYADGRIWSVRGLAAPVTHSNHPLLADGVKSLFEHILPDSLFRARRARRLIEECCDLDFDGLSAVLCDHFSYPSSICLHGIEKTERARRSATLTTVIMDLTRQHFYVSDRQGCLGHWNRYSNEFPVKNSERVDWSEFFGICK